MCGRLKDKFGDNGIVSVVAGKIEDEVLSIQLWLMSCRVLKRGMEDAMMNELVRLARQHGIMTIRGYYYPTAKKMEWSGTFTLMKALQGLKKRKSKM